MAKSVLSNSRFWENQISITLLCSCLLVMATGQLLNAKFGWDRCNAVVNGTFCFGVKGNVTSYPAGTGCFKTRDCDAFVHGDKGTDPQPGAARSHYMTWLIFAKTNVSNDKDTRVHFYITRDPEPVEPYPKYYPQDVLFVMGHRWTSRIPTFRPGPLPLQCSFIEEKGAKVSDCFRLINTANKLDNYWQDRGSGEKYEIAATGHTINWHGWLWSSQAVIMYPQSGPTVYSLNPRNRKCHPTLIVLESNLDSHGVEKSVTLRNYGTTSERVDLFGLLNAGEVGIDIDAQGRPLTTTTTTTTTTQAPITTTNATSTEVSSITESAATITSIPTTTDTATESPPTSKGEAKKSKTILLVVLGLVALLVVLGACAYFLTKKKRKQRDLRSTFQDGGRQSTILSSRSMYQPGSSVQSTFDGTRSTFSAMSNVNSAVSTGPRSYYAGSNIAPKI